MVRRRSFICTLILLLAFTIPLGGPASAQGTRDSAGPAQCADPATLATFQSASGATQVTICPSVVVTGHPLRVTVHTRRFTPVRVQIQFPDGTVASSGVRATDGLGQITFGFPIRYNPINRFVTAPFLVLVGKGGRVDTVAGTITIEQSAPLGNTRLRVRPAGEPAAANGLAWCPGDPTMCVVHNNTQIVIRVDTDPGAQVSVLLLYPDNQSVSCTGNDLTGTNSADDAGVYRCELPVVFQTKGRQGPTILRVVVQVSSGSYSRTLIQKLYLAPN